MNSLNLDHYVSVRTVDEYFELPKITRETRWGFYRKPLSLPSGAWEEFSERIRKEYPVQGWIREVVSDCDNPLVFLWSCVKWRSRDLFWSIYRRLSKEYYPRFKKAANIWAYKDTDAYIEDINTALLLDFWYIELECEFPQAITDTSDPDFDQKHLEYCEWFPKAIHFLLSGQKLLEYDKDAVFAQLDDSLSIERKQELFEEYIRLENEIQDKLTYVLEGIVRYRMFLWT